MNPNESLLQSIEKLGYRVTVGDVAAKAGLEINTAQQGLLALAAEAGGHLQVADTGEIIYLFPQNFRSILLNKYWQLKVKEWLNKIWKAIFYVIRISFGIILIISILIMFLAIMAIIIALMFKDSDSDSGSGDSRININFFPTDLFWIFYPNFNNNYYERKEREIKTEQTAKKINFLEAVFSFLFGDGDPNFNLEQRRWQVIGKVIQNNRGAIIAPQIAPYLDSISPSHEENEDYILPVLTRFNGLPKVSDRGDIIYYFPDLQVTAKEKKLSTISPYLKEKSWKFSEADSGQIILALGLGMANFILALVLGYFLKSGSVDLIGSFGVVITGLYSFLLAYACAFLGIPLGRYFFLQWRNGKVNQRNQQRQKRAELLAQNNPELLQKIQYSRQFADQKVISEDDITYSTDQDYLDQEIERSDKIDLEWQRRLESPDS
jgi:flagellar basal body-associated protein FliL